MFSRFIGFIIKLFSFRSILYIVKHYKSRQSVHYVIAPIQIPLLKELYRKHPRKIMVLDLDETLIHSVCDGSLQRSGSGQWPPDFVVRVNIERHPVRFFVHKRPHVDYFLDMVSQWYDLVIYTASLEVYGSNVIDRLEAGRNLFKKRFYRQHCLFVSGSYRKDLTLVSHDLSSIFIVDNSPPAYATFRNNAIPIETWFDSPMDTSLLNLLPFLDALRFTEDVRSVLDRHIHLTPPGLRH